MYHIETIQGIVRAVMVHLTMITDSGEVNVHTIDLAVEFIKKHEPDVSEIRVQMLHLPA